jgi:hypothetical protein
MIGTNLNETKLPSEEWLYKQLAQIIWKKSGNPMKIIDQNQDHRLIELSYHSASGKKSRAKILHGVDFGCEFWTRVASHLNHVEKAIEWLKPCTIIDAEKKKKEILRQGDWYFVRSKRFNPRKIYTNIPYGNHIIEKWSNGYASGKIKHHEHAELLLNGWYLPVRNKGSNYLGEARKIHDQKYWKNKIMNH